MADVQGGRGGVDADIDSYALFCEKPVKCFAAAACDQQLRRQCMRSTTYPATSLTNPRCSSRLSMLCWAPDRILLACSSHSACREALSGAPSAHFWLGRWPLARVCRLRRHRRQTYCRPCDKRPSINMAVNGSGAKRDSHLESDDRGGGLCAASPTISAPATMHVTHLSSVSRIDVDSSCVLTLPYPSIYFFCLATHRLCTCALQPLLHYFLDR